MTREGLSQAIRYLFLGLFAKTHGVIMVKVPPIVFPIVIATVLAVAGCINVRINIELPPGHTSSGHNAVLTAYVDSLQQINPFAPGHPISSWSVTWLNNTWVRVTATLPGLLSEGNVTYVTHDVILFPNATAASSYVKDPTRDLSRFEHSTSYVIYAQNQTLIDVYRTAAGHWPDDFEQWTQKGVAPNQPASSHTVTRFDNLVDNTTIMEATPPIPTNAAPSMQAIAVSPFSDSTPTPTSQAS
ncbi:MAG: hypothetical protein ACXV3T_06560 [Halobacteriota archaeon]